MFGPRRLADLARQEKRGRFSWPFAAAPFLTGRVKLAFLRVPQDKSEIAASGTLSHVGMAVSGAAKCED